MAAPKRRLDHIAGMKEPVSVVTTLIKPPMKSQRPNTPATTEMNRLMRDL
jgi:hypothetical protein